MVLGMNLFPQYVMISRAQEMNEEENGESDKKDEKQ